MFILIKGKDAVPSYLFFSYINCSTIFKHYESNLLSERAIFSFYDIY
jgi:hypothetical protein